MFHYKANSDISWLGTWIPKKFLVEIVITQLWLEIIITQQLSLVFNTQGVNPVDGTPKPSHSQVRKSVHWNSGTETEVAYGG